MPKSSASGASFWPRQRVIVTGGAGFLGSFVVNKLQDRGCTSIIIPRSSDYDLREKPAIQRLLTESNPTIIIHLAANCGGIGANQSKSPDFFYDNAIMGIQLME